MKKLWLSLLAMAVAAGCGGPSEAPPSGDTSAGRDAMRSRLGADRIEIAVMPKSTSHQFWETVRAGAEKARLDFNVSVLWKGPAKETEIPEQINLVEDMITRKVDAIVLAACDKDALVDVVAQAVKAGIPVVTIDSGVESDLPVSFVATDNEAGAKAAADKLAELIGGAGEVALLPFVPGAATSVMRENGFKKGLEAHPNLKLVATQYSNSDVAKAMSATQDMMTANPNLAGIFAANEASAIGAAQAVQAAGKAGQIKIVAFDAHPAEIQALKEGVIQALIVQNPFQMGYLGVKTAVDAINGRPVEKRIDTGVTIVTKDNLETPEIQQILNPTAASETTAGTAAP